MAQKRPTRVERKKQYSEFLAKYKAQIGEGIESDEGSARLPTLGDISRVETRLVSVSDPAGEFGRWWLIELLRKAADENNLLACQQLLRLLCVTLDVMLPEGVIPSPRRSGRQLEDLTHHIRKGWIEMGKPPINAKTCDELARGIYPDEFAKAGLGSKKRKRLRDRIGATIRRYQVDLRRN
jgi:hypothetical protein